MRSLLVCLGLSLTCKHILTSESFLNFFVDVEYHLHNLVFSIIRKLDITFVRSGVMDDFRMAELFVG